MNSNGKKTPSEKVMKKGGSFEQEQGCPCEGGKVAMPLCQGVKSGNGKVVPGGCPCSREGLRNQKNR